MIGRRFTHRDLNIRGEIVNILPGHKVEVKYDSLRFVRVEEVSKLKIDEVKA